MSLTILVHSDAPVVIVRWLLEPKGLVIHAGGPVVQMPLEEFRLTGCEWVHRHFDEYAKIRVPEDRILPVFGAGEAKRVMKRRRALEIHIDPQQNLIFSPMIVERYALGDLRRVKPLAEQTIPLTSSPEGFWKAFDQVLAVAPISE
jgi:hypothetical protein